MFNAVYVFDLPCSLSLADDHDDDDDPPQTVVLPKSVTPSRIVENHQGEIHVHTVRTCTVDSRDRCQVFELPREDFDKLETAASKHPPERTSNPSKRWGLSFDVFDGE